MVDLTKLSGSLLNWTELDDTGGVPTVASGELNGEGMSDAIGVIVHIDCCHKDTNDASTNNVEVVTWIKSGGSADQWHELVRFQADGGVAHSKTLAGTSVAGQDRVRLGSATTNFEGPGSVFFIKDLSYLGSSQLVVNKDFVNDDYVQAVENLAYSYGTSDIIYDIVNQWNVQLPKEAKVGKVTFHNPDGDAIYAVRVRYSMATDLE